METGYSGRQTVKGIGMGVRFGGRLITPGQEFVWTIVKFRTVIKKLAGNAWKRRQSRPLCWRDSHFSQTGKAQKTLGEGWEKPGMSSRMLCVAKHSE